MGIAGTHFPRQLQAFISLKTCAEEQLEVGIRLLKEAFEISFHAFFCAVQRLQHAQRRQKVRTGTLFTTLAQAESHRGYDRHEAVDRGGHAAQQCQIKEDVEYEIHALSRRPSRSNARHHARRTAALVSVKQGS
jgi:hypothetical protein